MPNAGRACRSERVLPCVFCHDSPTLALLQTRQNFWNCCGHNFWNPHQERPVIETSLFPSDKSVLDEEAIQRILTSKFAMPSSMKIAIFRLQENVNQAVQYYGYGYWRSEEYLKIQQGFIDTIATEIAKSDRVEDVASLPSLLTPKEPTLP